MIRVIIFLDLKSKMKKYPSKYSNGKSVSASQYITELICEKELNIYLRILDISFGPIKIGPCFIEIK